MSNVKWIKLSTQMFDDEKIKLIEQMPDADTILVIWVKLLSQAGKANANGYIYLSETVPYTDEMLATIFGRPLNTIRFALETFRQFGMIEVDEENFISIANWEKHQNVEGLDRIREQTRKRVAKHRKKQKQLSNDSNVPVTLRNATEEELELEEELEEERDKDKDKPSQPKKSNGNLKSLEEIEAFVDLKINVLPSGVSKKILVKYIDCIRLTRSTCRISENLVSNLLDKFAKYSIDQLNYAMWTHFDKHDDKNEKYTLGILRNTKESEAKQGLLKLKNGSRGANNATNQRGIQTDDRIQSKIEAANERRQRILEGKSNREVNVDF